jgi:hypothetical protein
MPRPLTRHPHIACRREIAHSKVLENGFNMHALSAQIGFSSCIWKPCKVCPIRMQPGRSRGGCNETRATRGTVRHLHWELDDWKRISREHADLAARKHACRTHVWCWWGKDGHVGVPQVVKAAIHLDTPSIRNIDVAQLTKGLSRLPSHISVRPHTSGVQLLFLAVSNGVDAKRGRLVQGIMTKRP